MFKISIGRFAESGMELTAEAIHAEVVRFAGLLSSRGIQSVRVWCSWNPDLPEDSPLQSPNEILPPRMALDFFNAAVQNGVWAYGDSWNRAGIDAIDGSFTFFLGNDKDIRVETTNQDLLDAVRSAWSSTGYKIHEHDGKPPLGHTTES